MGKKIILKASLKGDRKYLHSTDIIIAILHLIGRVNNFSFRMHKITSKKLYMHFVDNDELNEYRSQNVLVALMTCIKDGKNITIVFTETNQQVTDRYPYNEKKVTSGYLIHDNTITQQSNNTGNFIERIVGLNKTLLNERVENNPWLFSRIDLQFAPFDCKLIEISYLREIGKHTYLSKLICDEKFTGKIFFSKKKSYN